MRVTWADRAIRLCLVAAWLCLPGAAAAGTVKIGVLKFGTVNWTLDVVKTHGLDRAEGVTLEVLPLASKNATSVALQAREVDMIVTDWIWVARQRAEGAGYSFVPYSTALGALMVPADSPIRGLADLAGKRLGIAGGPIDKSWLLLRALASQREEADLDETVEKVFAAPPLLNEQILVGRLDAVLTYWHYAARLEAAGYRRLVGVQEIARDLGAESELPLVGYVFDQDWAAAHRKDLEGFLRAVGRAKSLLADSDEEWQRLRPLMKAKDEATFLTLRDRYREGIPKAWGASQQADAGRIFDLLAKLGGKKLVGRADSLQDGTFWPGAGD